MAIPRLRPAASARNDADRRFLASGLRPPLGTTKAGDSSPPARGLRSE